MPGNDLGVSSNSLERMLQPRAAARLLEMAGVLRSGCPGCSCCIPCCVASVRSSSPKSQIPPTRGSKMKRSNAKSQFSRLFDVIGRGYPPVSCENQSQVLRRPLLKRYSYGFRMWRSAVVRQVTCPNMPTYLYLWMYLYMYNIV